MNHKGKNSTAILSPIKYLCLACVLSICVEAYAGPDETTRFLINEPVSEFSLGMWRLQKVLNIFSGDNDNIFFIAEYNWDDDRINIMSNFITMPPTKDNCRNILAQLREAAGVDPQKGILNPNQKSFSKFARLFKPHGYVHKSAPKDYLKNLDGKFHIEVMLIGEKRGLISCEGKLISNRVLYDQ